MINPWNFLFNNKQNKNIEFAPLQRDPLANSAGTRPDGTFAQAPSIEAVLLDNNGHSLPNQTIQPERRVTLGDRAKNKVTNLSQRVGDLLLGQRTEPTDNINIGDGTINATISNNPRKGGLLRDFAGGFRENLTTPASLENFGQNTLADGRRKGFGYRAGEALGTLGRVLESPLGRGLLTAGIVGATGGSGLEALAYGGTAGSLNQQLRNNDRMYRNDLITTQQNALRNNEAFNKLSEAEQAQQLNNIENNINRMRGYVTPDTYNNFIRSQQLRENADWRKFYYDDQKAERQLTREIAQQEREYQHQQDAINNQIRREQIAQQAADRSANRDIQYARLGLEREKMFSDLSKPNEEVQGLRDIENQLNNFEATFKYLPTKIESYTLGNLRKFTGTQTPQEANFEAQRTLLFNQIARKLGGEKGVLSDNDIKRIEAALPTLGDSLQQKYARMEAVYDLLDIKKGQTPRSQTFSSGKYTVRVKG